MTEQTTALAVSQQDENSPMFGSRQLAAGANVGAVAIEQERAIAEAQGQLILAKRFPRDLNVSYAELMESCRLPAMASVAFYSVPQGNSKVTGPSIRLAEEIARVYGNMEYGHRELSRIDAGPHGFGRSEVEVYAWDKQANNRSVRQITVLHTLDTKDGPKKLRDQKEIDNKIANVASKQMRGRLLALLPKWLVESAVQECRKTLAGNSAEPLAERVRKMIGAFAAVGVTVDHLECYIGKPLDQLLVDELVDLQGVYNSIRVEGIKPSEIFGQQEQQPQGEAAKLNRAPLAGSAAGSGQAASSAAGRSNSTQPAAAAAAAAPANDNAKPAATRRAVAKPEQAAPAEQAAEAQASGPAAALARAGAAMQAAEAPAPAPSDDDLPPDGADDGEYF